MTALYSVLHMFVDGVCAFALQMPFGAVLDLWYAKSGKHNSFAVACVGIVLTLVGAVTHPVILGIGNALFHIGGGVGTIHEDERKGWQGRGLGVFVAPGALGLYLGMQLAQNGAEAQWLYGAGAFMAIACSWAFCRNIMGCVPCGAASLDVSEVLLCCCFWRRAFSWEIRTKLGQQYSPGGCGTGNKMCCLWCW